MAERSQFRDSSGGFLGLGNLSRFTSNPFPFLLEQAAVQGGIARFRLGTLGRFYLVTDPEYIREILVKQWGKTVKWERLSRASGRVAAFNIVFLEGDVWKSQRKLLTPAFHTERVQDYLNLMHRHTLQMLDDWQSGGIYDIKQMMTAVTMGIISEILFDIQDIQRDVAAFGEAIDVLITQFVAEVSSLVVLPQWLPLKRHQQGKAAREFIISYLTELTRQRRKENTDHGDVLSALLLARDAQTGESLTDEQIRDELYSLFVAGHETTSLWLSWTLYMLAKHPDVQQRLAEEIASSAGDAAPSVKHLNETSLLDRVLKETLRMYPPAWSLFMRRVVEDIQLNGQVIPKGGIVYISPWVQHHLPQYWEEPDAFNPERFAGDWKTERPAYSFMPFGGGARVCLGAYLAEVEAKVILQTIIRHYAVSLTETQQEVFMDGGFTLRPYPGLQLRVQRRTRV